MYIQFSYKDTHISGGQMTHLGEDVRVWARRRCQVRMCVGSLGVVGGGGGGGGGGCKNGNMLVVWMGRTRRYIIYGWIMAMSMKDTDDDFEVNSKEQGWMEHGGGGGWGGVVVVVVVVVVVGGGGGGGGGGSRWC